MIRARIFIMLSVLEVTQRVPPTCIIKTDFTYHKRIAHCNSDMIISTTLPSGYLNTSHIENSVSLDSSSSFVFPHQIQKKDMFGYMQQSKVLPVCSYCDRYWKSHNEYHQHVSYRRTLARPPPPYPTRAPILIFDSRSRPCKIFQTLVEHWNKRKWNRSLSVKHTRKRWKNIAWITSTPQVIRACSCILWSIPQVTSRVPPTCTIKMSRTW